MHRYIFVLAVFILLNSTAYGGHATSTTALPVGISSNAPAGLHNLTEKDTIESEKSLPVSKQIDPEFLGLSLTDERKNVKVFIATENLPGLAEELREIGLNVSFGQVTSYSKLIFPVVETETWRIPQLATLKNALYIGKYPETINLENEITAGNSNQMLGESTNYTGDNTTTALITSGIEFGLPVLKGKYAIWGNDTQYAGFPRVFDFSAIYEYLESGKISNKSWFVDTGYNTSAYVRNNSVYVDFDNTTYNVTGIPTLSSTFHIGYMPESVSDAHQGRRMAVIVTDAHNLWKYDAVYVDLDNDLSFSDEVELNNSNHISTKDLNGDGKPDISSGLLYWVSDGSNTIPYSRFVAERFGFNNIVPESGDLLCFFGDYYGGYGTQVAEALVSCANRTAIIPVAVHNDTNMFEVWQFCAYGADYLPNSGDEFDVCMSSFMFEVHTNYWNYIDRYLTSLLENTPTVFVFPGGNRAGISAPNSIDAVYPAPYTISGNGTFIASNGEQMCTFLAPSTVSAYASFAHKNFEWNMLRCNYSGAAISAAITAGSTAKIIELLRAQGTPYKASSIRNMLINACNDTLIDAVAQGRGVFSEKQAIEIALGSANTVLATPFKVRFGSYNGVDYPSFENVVYAGTTSTKAIKLTNCGDDKNIQISATMLRKQAIMNFSFTGGDANSTYFFSLSDFINRNSSVCRISISSNDGIENCGAYVGALYGWFDYNENMIEDPGEIEKITEAQIVNGMGSCMFAVANWSNLSALYMKFIPVQGIANLTFHGDIEYFSYAPAAYIENVSVFIPGNFSLDVDLNLTVPADALPGMYEGKILLSYGSTTKSVPFTLNVIAETERTYNMSERNTYYFDYVLTAEPGSSSSRWLFINLPDGTTEGWTHEVIRIKTSAPVVVEHYQPYNDAFSILSRPVFGPCTLISSQRIDAHEDTGTLSNDTIFVILKDGLNAIRFTSKFFKDTSSASVLSIEIFKMQITGETDYEGIWWRDKYEIMCMASDTVNFTLNAYGTTPGNVQEILNQCLTEIPMTVEENGTFVCRIEGSAWATLYLESTGNISSLYAYSIDGKIFVPSMRPGNYRMQVFATETTNVTWALITGQNVSANLVPDGEIPPYSDFYIGAEMPPPEKPGTYFAVVCLSDGTVTTPCEILLSQKILDLPPEITELSPENNSVVNNARIYGKYADQEGTLKSNISMVLLYLNNVNYSALCLWNNTQFTLPLVLDEGYYVLVVEVYDANNMYTRAEVCFTVDRTVPYLLVETPANYFLTNQNFIIVTGRCELDAVVFVNGFQAESDEPGTFFQGINLMEGWNVIEISARDAAGNVARETRFVCLDTSPPALSVLSPENNYVTRSSYLMVSGVSEYGAQITVNGVPAQADISGRFEVGIEISDEGENLVNVIARDAAGNENTQNFVVVLDRTPPELTLEDCAPLTGNPVCTISGTVRDANPEDFVYVNSIKTSLVNQWFSVKLMLSEGKNIIRVVATDRAGNVDIKTLQIILDTTPPSLNLSLPQTVTSREYRINGTTEPGAVVQINDVSVYVQPNGNFSYVVNLSKGVNFITVQARDTIGNTKVVTFAVLYVDPNDLNIDDVKRYNSLDKRITELMDTLVYAVLALLIILVVGIAGLYNFLAWQRRKEREEPDLKKVFEEPKKP